MSQSASSFGLNAIGQIGVTVADLPRAIAFYRDTLGMRFLFQAGTMVFFDCGGIRLLLGLPEAAGPAAGRISSIIYYKVTDIQEAHKTLVARGVAFLASPRLVARLADHDLWLAEFRDPDGNFLALMSEVRH
ncbi:MAG: VOC family protein [Candidatus Acidiferrales bacterium]